MQISALGAANALNLNPMIAASSNSNAKVSAVAPVQRRQMPAAEVTLSDEFDFPEVMGSSESKQEGQIVPAGTAYGMPVSDLQNTGLRFKLMGADEEEGTVTGELPEQSPQVEEENAADKAAEQNAPKNVQGQPLSEEELQVVRELEARDAEVRRHEQAHIAAAGGLAQGGASFSYQRGPDGEQYAIGGEVSIDTSKAATPEATVQKMQRIKAAAMAPASPSGQDRAVAASASRMQQEATQEIAQARTEAADENRPGSENEVDAVSPIENSKSGNIDSAQPDKDEQEGGLMSPEKLQEVSEEASDNAQNTGVVTPAIVAPELAPSNQQQVPSKLSFSQARAITAYGLAS